MKLRKAKRVMAAAMISVMALSLAACGGKSDDSSSKEESTKKEETAKVEKPDAVSEEDWEAMQKEPVFGQELNYLFNGGACVSAKYMATGNSQDISITASTNLSDEDIEKAVKDAEAHAAEDKKQKDGIEAKNNASSLIYNCEKTLSELGDKISSEEKAKVETEIENLKKVKDSDDIEAIKAATEKLTTTFYSVSEKLYSQAQQAQGANPGAEGNVNTDENGNVYNADYKVEDDNNDNK